MEPGEVKFGGAPPTFEWLGPEPDFVLVPNRYLGPLIRVDIDSDPLLAIDQSSSVPELPYGEYAL